MFISLEGLCESQSLSQNLTGMIVLSTMVNTDGREG